MLGFVWSVQLFFFNSLHSLAKNENKTPFALSPLLICIFCRQISTRKWFDQNYVVLFVHVTSIAIRNGLLTVIWFYIACVPFFATRNSLLSSYLTYVALVADRNGLLTNLFSCVATDLWPLGKSCCCRQHLCFEVVFRSDNWQELLLNSAYITYVCLRMNTYIYICNISTVSISNHPFPPYVRITIDHISLYSGMYCGDLMSNQIISQEVTHCPPQFLGPCCSW